ncbi:hypothetical protein Dimus_007048 [Dionaea muscipula]
MEADGGRSVPPLKVYDVYQSTIRPSIADLEEPESYLACFTRPLILSCSTSNVETSSFSSLAAAAKRSRTNSCLPRWDGDVQSTLSTTPPDHDSSNFCKDDGSILNRFGQAYARKNSLLSQCAAMQQQSPEDHRRSHLKCGEFLGMNRSGLALEDEGDGSTSGSHVVYLNSPCKENTHVTPVTSMMGNQGISHGSTQQISSNYMMETIHCGIPSHLYGNPYDPNSPQHTQNSSSNGNRSVFAPATPDGNTFSSEQTRLSASQAAYEQNKGKENQVDVMRVRGLQNEGETPPGSDVTRSKMSTFVENHDPDKGSNADTNLNKTPQQKPRRKKHRPRVVREDKPKRGPKPRTPKPINPMGNPRPKRKYVRKNKTNQPSTTPVGSTKEPNLNVPDPPVKSCRRSLNFDLDGQVRDCSVSHKSGYNSHSAPQANGGCGPEIPLRRSIHLGKEKEAVEETPNRGIAYALSYSVNQLGKDYIQLLHEETPKTSCLTKTVPSQANGKIFAGYHDSSLGSKQAPAYSMPMERSSIEGNQADYLWEQSKNFSTNMSPVNEEHRPKRSRSYSVNKLDEDTRNLANTHGGAYSPSYLFLGDEKIKRMTSNLFPEICKKRRNEKVQRPNTSCASSATTLQEVREVDIEQTGPGGNPTASKYYYCPPAPHFTAAVNDLEEEAGASSGCKLPLVNDAWPDIEKLKKRPKGPTCIRDLASPTRFAVSTDMGITPGDQAAKYACMQALKAGTRGPRTTKKRSRTGVVCSYQSNIMTAKMQQDVVLDGNHQRVGNVIGSYLALPWKITPFENATVDNIADELQLLNMNRESSNIACTEENALVPYHASGQVEASSRQRQNALGLYHEDGTVVPFVGKFKPVRKKQQRVKVDLDEETTRVWKLLLENIDNKGIDGTDEDKAKWWEEERRVFHGRVDSFIARMRLVQGDRRFSPWKGSVVDSVIGVFLTQNVSDQLSSSAFMSLAAHFPLKSRSKLNPHYEEGASASPEDSTLDLEGLETWSAKISDEPVCDRSSRTLYDVDHGLEKEAVNSREVFGRNIGLSPQDIICGLIDPNSCESSQGVPQEHAQRGNNYTIDTETASTQGDAKEMDDITSSQQSGLSSQISANSLCGLTAGRMGSCSESNSEVEDLRNSPRHSFFGNPLSFQELLKSFQIPNLPENCKTRISQASFYQESADNEPQGREHGNQQRMGLQKVIYESSVKEPTIARLNRMHLKRGVQDANCIQMADEESRASDKSATKDDYFATEQSDLTTESTIQSPLLQKFPQKIQKSISSAENVCPIYALEGERMVMHSQRQVREPHERSTPPVHEPESLMPGTASLPLGRTHCESECIQSFHDRKTNGNNKMPDPGKDATGSATEMANVGNTKQTKGKTRIGKKTAFDWDSLRKHAEMKGRKRERAPHTMDSLDYEAVRLADVGEIADTIKERGMNNVLAERMKDFLNRLVSEHGSIDLEWLRDVPPDKAKEYLLSIRGLGLKSVECVRLLTLHHLAFPVDTNVGRIAVRLGWVPLQPLPESLQLHLLELYPVLESIQKYLWPRLCKLDQRTLYELHYHMITFGKVFCTKRKPNCNACPLRGECRHFASAFASARLSLPGPEEKSIVASSQCGVPHQDPQAAINPMALPPPQANLHVTSALCGLAYQDPPVIINPLLQTNQSASTHPCLAYQDPQVNITPFLLPLPPAEQNSDAKITSREPIIEVPASPEQEQTQLSEGDMEDMFCEDPNEIPTIKLNMEQLTRTLESYMQSKAGLQQSEISKALVTLTAETAYIPAPKLKNVSRLRTEHHVYELPDTHPLLDGLDKREPDDPCSYLLAIWSPGETANSVEPPYQRCSSREPGQLCNDEACFHCNSQREANCQIVRGTLLIPCRTAMRGSFPLNGTYFQVNEVFADHNSSLNPIAVPRNWLWNLPRRTVCFGTSVQTIFRGLSTEGIQHCFWRGYVCVRGFDQKTRAPRPLMARLHFPASKMTKAKGKPHNQASTM